MPVQRLPRRAVLQKSLASGPNTCLTTYLCAPLGATLEGSSSHADRVPSGRPAQLGGRSRHLARSGSPSRVCAVQRMPRETTARFSRLRLRCVQAPSPIRVRLLARQEGHVDMSPRRREKDAGVPDAGRTLRGAHPELCALPSMPQGTAFLTRTRVLSAQLRAPVRPRRRGRGTDSHGTSESPRNGSMMRTSGLERTTLIDLMRDLMLFRP